MYKLLKHIYEAIIFLIAFIIGNLMLINKKNRQVYLIGERRNEARDNGYHLFKYIRENHPEDRVFYVIEKSSDDFNKVKKYRNILEYGSFKHYLMVCIADKLICAHLDSCLIDTPIVWKALDYKLIKAKRVFIQHGITISNHHSLMYDNNKIDKFICGAKPEYEYINTKFGYPEDSVKYLGFCRFDNLHNYKLKNIVLLMPTWRAWLGGETWGGNDYNKFIQSQYYKKYSSLIHNPQLIDLLKENNLKLIFYPHYEMQKYIKSFKSYSNRIIIANKENYDVQNLLKESRILITDYSSIAFDFAYMRKPVLYYQFDTNKYYREHYNKGYFDYKKHGFGPVLEIENELVMELKKIVDNKIQNIDYKERISDFFELYDNQNCKRNYEEIKKI